MGATDAQRPILACADVHKSFGAVRALRGASLQVERGTIHGLVGHNGAGKSTLIKIVAGMQQADAGTILLDGEPVGDGDRRAAIARGIWSVPQELTVLPNLTVVENVCVGAEARGGSFRVRWGEMRARAAVTLAQLGAGEIDPDAVVGKLRPAQKRMVMIAMAVSRRSRLLILDEPTAALATEEVGPLLRLIEGLTADGTTVVYISHRLDEVERLCDRVTVMRDGVTRETLARGAFDAAELVRRMVDELPDRLPRSPRAVAAGAGAVPAISVRGLRGRTLQGVDVDVRAGAITGFTGLVGSGTRELLEIVSGGARPLGGTLEVDGSRASFRSRADALDAGIAYLPETRANAAFLDLTVRENVLASSLERVAGPGGLLLGRRERMRAEEMVTSFGLKDRVERAIGELSGGNQQKVLMARLLAAEARVLVVNDPTAGVDVKARADIHALLREVADAGLAVIVSCSEPEELLDLADAIHVFAGGRLVAHFDGEHPDLGALLEASSTSGARS